MLNPEEKWSFEEMVDPKHTALIVVDMQNDYCSSNGASCKQGRDIGMTQRMTPKLADFLTRCRALGLAVIHTRNVHSEFSDTPAWKRRSGGIISSAARLNSWGAGWFEEYPEFTPRSEEYVIDKHRYSAFINTDLEIVLKAKGIRTVLMTGTATNVCVESTARHALMLDYHVVLVKDCCATYSKVLQEATELNIQNHFGVTTPSDRIVSVWAETYKLDSLRNVVTSVP